MVGKSTTNQFRAQCLCEKTLHPRLLCFIGVATPQVVALKRGLYSLKHLTATIGKVKLRVAGRKRGQSLGACDASGGLPLPQFLFTPTTEPPRRLSSQDGLLMMHPKGSRANGEELSSWSAPN